MYNSLVVSVEIEMKTWLWLDESDLDRITVRGVGPFAPKDKLVLIDVDENETAKGGYWIKLLQLIKNSIFQLSLRTIKRLANHAVAKA